MMQDPRLTAYALGELQGEDKAQVEAWLADHPEGRDEVDAIRGMASVLKRGLAEEPQPELNESQRKSLLRPRRRILIWAPVAAAAALVWAVAIQPMFSEPLNQVEPAPNPPVISVERQPGESNDVDGMAYRVDESGQKVAMSNTEAFENAEIAIIPFDEAPPEIQALHREDLRRRGILEGKEQADPEPVVGLDAGSDQSDRSDGSANQIAGNPGASDPPKPAESGEMPHIAKTMEVEGKAIEMDNSTAVIASVAEGSDGDNGADSGNQIYGYLSRNRKPGDKVATGSLPSRDPTLDTMNLPDGVKESHEFIDSLPKSRALLSPDIAGAGTISGAQLFENEYLLDGVSVDEWEIGIPDSVRETPVSSTESYDALKANPLFEVANQPLSTFSVDMDTASYSNVRRFLNQGQRPPSGAVRVEELVNYFEYRYPLPNDEHPFSASIDITSAPWDPDRRLARIGLQGAYLDAKTRPAANLVFLIDVSGSMSDANKLPLVKYALERMTQQLRPDDRVGMVVYAGSSGVVLDSTSGSKKAAIVESLQRLESGGSTNGAAGIEAAYDLAQKAFIPGGVNRVVLATDGDFNVGSSDRSSLLELIETKAKTGVFLTVLGFGMGNYKDDTLEMLADKGNGFYAYIDNEAEAERVMVRRLMSTLVTIAKDVKIQVEFNPNEVSAYRLLGYENRMLEHQDFNDDRKDAGEIGAGHSVTAIYEIVPAGQPHKVASVDPLKYQVETQASEAAYSGELFTLKLRYKQPDGDTSQLLEFVAHESHANLDSADQETKFAIAVAGFAMRLRGELSDEELSWSMIAELAREGLGSDEHGDRAAFLDLVRKAATLK